MTNDSIIICQCHSAEHQIIFREFKDDKFISMEVHLNKLPILKRIRYALKYIFGHQSKYGAFAEFIFKPEDAEILQNLTNRLKQQK